MQRIGTKKVRDPLFKRALIIIVMENKASAALLQKELGVGYVRAMRILDELQEEGYVKPAGKYWNLKEAES